MQVPTYDNLQVAPEQRPGVRYNAAPVDEIPAQQNAALGQAMQSAGGQVQQIIAEEQAKADTIRIDDALNQTKALIGDATYNPKTGYLVKRGKAAFPEDKPLDAVYAEDLNAKMQEIASGLGNERQRQLYRQHANAALTDFRTGVQRHSTQEFQRYGIQTNNATVEMEINSVGSDWKDDTLIGRSLYRVASAIKKNSELTGVPWDDPITKGLLQKATSEIHARVVKAALEAGDTTRAADYFKAVSGQMTFDDSYRLKEVIDTQQRIGVADRSTQRALMQAAPAMAPTNTTRFEEITWQRESGGRQLNPDGSPVTSPKGATGIAQVMPDTGPEAAKLAGLPWDEKRFKTDATYNKALGSAYLHKQLQDFGNDPAKAWAAYNAGPGALHSALAAEKNPKNAGKVWLDFLPKETRDYVTANMAKLAAGEGTPAKPTLEAVIQSALADPEVVANPHPDLEKRIIDNATRRFHAMNEATAQRGREAVSAGQRWIIDNPGKSWESDAPIDLREAVKQAAPGQWDDLRRFSKKEADTDRSVWYGLKDRIAKGEQVDLLPFMNRLSRADFNDLDDMQRNPAKLKDAATLHEQLSTYHLMLGLGNSDGDKLKKGMLNHAVEVRIQQETEAKGKALNFNEREAIIKDLITKGEIPGRVWDTSGRKYEFVGTPNEAKFVAESSVPPAVPNRQESGGTIQPRPVISAAERAKIVEALQGEGNPVTEAAIIELYRARHP